MSQFYRNLALWLIIGLIMIFIFNYFSSKGPPEISYTDFLEHVGQGHISTVSIQGETITGQYAGTEGLSGGFKTATPTPNDPDLMQLLREKHVSVTVKPPAWVFLVLVGSAIIVFLMWRGQVEHFVHAALAAAFYTGLLWYWHSQTPLPAEVSGFDSIPALRFKLFESGWIPFAILWTFLAGLHYLVLIGKHKFVPLNMANVADQDVLEAARTRDDRALVSALNVQGARGYYRQRLYQLRERLSRDQDLAAVIALKDDILEIDEEDFALAFVAITWCEAALPLWGFLGTVVGIGDAVVAVARGVRALFGGTPMERVLDDLNRGFQGMGVAFDTTFLGLAGLIVLGMGHMALKKGLAVRLAQARSLFSNVVSQWTADSAGPVVVALTGLEARLQAVEAAVRSTDIRATMFRESARMMVERVLTEDPAYRSIRQVLFKPVVVFQRVGQDLAEQTTKHVTDRLGPNWEFVTLGLPLATNLRSVSHGGVVAISSRTPVQSDADKSPEENWLLPFDVAGPYNQDLFQTGRPFTTLFLLSDPSIGLGHTDAGDLVSVHMAQLPQTQEHVLPFRMGADDHIFQVVVDQKLLALIIRRAPQASHFDVSWVGDSYGGGHSQPEDVGQLPQNYEWTVWSAHAPSATLLAAGKSITGNRWRLLLAPIRQRPAEKERESQRGLPASFQFTSLDHWIDLPSGLLPRRIVPLANDLILILDTSGKLHYWDTTRPAPLRLSHEAWADDPDCTIQAGAGGWIAVIAKDHLRMWRVRRGGFLYLYEDVSLPIELAKRDSFRVTADGRYMFAIAQQVIATWEFPRYAMDVDDA